MCQNIHSDTPSFIWHGMWKPFVSTNTLHYSTLLRTIKSKRYEFWAGKNLWFKVLGKEKTMTGIKEVFKLFMRVSWHFGLIAIQRFHLRWKSPLSSAIESEAVKTGKEVWESLISSFNIGRKLLSCTYVVSQSAYIADIQHRLIIRQRKSSHV